MRRKSISERKKKSSIKLLNNSVKENALKL